MYRVVPWTSLTVSDPGSMATGAIAVSGKGKGSGLRWLVLAHLVGAFSSRKLGTWRSTSVAPALGTGTIVCMLVPRVLIVAALALVLAACGSPRDLDRSSVLAETSTTQALEPLNVPAGTNAVVERVVDGDTLVAVAVADGKKLTVRIIGVDTPEVGKSGRQGECYADEAALFLSQNYGPGTAVRLVPDKEPLDVYKRHLFYLYRLTDGLSAGDALVSGGYAKTMSVDPNVAQATHLSSLERLARSAKVGLWGACR